MKNEKIKVMIVDDSLLQRAMLRKTIESDPRFKVVATAEDGEIAVKKVEWFDIDVITMDVEMPKKNGLEALEEIMQKNPKPVIMVSSLTKEGSKETLKALSLGAVDFIEKPPIGANPKEVEKEIKEKLYQASLTNKKALKETFDLKRTKKIIEVKEKEKKEKKSVKKTNRTGVSNLIAIGTSTGGPSALSSILPQLPKDLEAAIVIVQHMPEGKFIRDLANILNEGTYFCVKEAENGEVIQNGHVYIAPGGYHLEVFNRRGNLHNVISKKDYGTSFMPSVDVLFSSIARLQLDIPSYGVVLTGMGSDGLKGAHALKREGGMILAESEETAVIYGMPKHIVNNNLANHVLPLSKIIPVLTNMIQKN